MTDPQFILAQDRLDAAQLALDGALTAMRSLGYQPVEIEEAVEYVALWRRGIAADRADTLSVR